MNLARFTGQRPADVLQIERTDLRDGALWIVQNKTKTKRAIEITGELAQLIERISTGPRERLSAWLIQEDDGKPLGSFGLRSRSTRRGRWPAWIFSSGISGPRQRPTQATWRTPKSCLVIATAR